MLYFVNSRGAPPPPGGRAILASIVIGDRYFEVWRRLAAASWLAYAERIGADIAIVTEPFDDRYPLRSPAWQKLLILEQPWAERYERVICLDSDIVISATAPNILAFSGPPEKIGICVDGGRASTGEMHILLERLLKQQVPPSHDAQVYVWHQENLYDKYETPRHPLQLNTGVMALSARHHRELLRSVYETPQFGMLNEQPRLTHEILMRALHYVMSPRFNWSVFEGLNLYLKQIAVDPDAEPIFHDVVKLFLRAELRNAYFLHFYGSFGLMERLSADDLFGRDRKAA